MSAAASSSSDAPAAPPAPASVLFARGVIARLALWPALRIAVEQGWGGPESAEKRTWIASVIVDSFEEEDPKPDVPYVEMQLLQIMEDEFETALEDGSAEAVAKDVVRMFDEVQRGMGDLVKHFEEQADKMKGKKIQVEEVAGDNEEWEDESGEDDEDEDDDDDAPMLVDSQPPPPKPEPEVDEDGFTMVKGKGKSHR
ncbi:pre-rRNA-processing protein TSR2-domain-containing protein [Phanerochaete sordida]|uniref:Pre-rRNA-processing protein TSR2-domain-containing protein n=1 Tax=Phanerochaete sordida TaxID=48140 RepID=A0A9P3L6J7_9APHY|nr:pre-rRNA-processing protein TSR2-domain-containing protein [Phanerochaete sordida]